jgi:hypothetical protein
LRQIKAGAAELVHPATMNWNHKRIAPTRGQIFPAQPLAEMSARLGRDPMPAPRAASWPAGVSLLAQMVDACQRCDADEVCADWLARAPKKIATPPAFCPNVDALKKSAKP